MSFKNYLFLGSDPHFQNSLLDSSTQEDDSGSFCDQFCRKHLYFFLGNFHCYLFLIGFIVRYHRHKNIGKYNLRAPRPRTYVLKIFLQSIMAITVFSMIYDINKASGVFEPLSLIYIFYGLIWLLSIYLQYFEYKRGLPHAWYTHQTFWILSFLSNLVLFVLLIEFDGLFNFRNDSEEKLDKSVQIHRIVSYSIAITASFTLSVLGIKYKRETP